MVRGGPGWLIEGGVVVPDIFAPYIGVVTGLVTNLSVVVPVVLSFAVAIFGGILLFGMGLRWVRHLLWEANERNFVER